MTAGVRLNSLPGILKKTVGVFLSKEKVFIAAVLASLLIHTLWFSIISVASPKVSSPVKFSKVSFFGPVFGRGVIEARPVPKELSFLDKRYLKSIRDVPTSGSISTEKYVYAEDVPNKNIDRIMAPMIVSATAGLKSEPSRFVE